MWDVVLFSEKQLKETALHNSLKIKWYDFMSAGLSTLEEGELKIIWINTDTMTSLMISLHKIYPVHNTPQAPTANVQITCTLLDSRRLK